MKAQRLICTDIRRIELAEFELPRVPDHGILVQNDYTAVSVGTEIYGYAHGGEPSSAITFPRSTGYCNTGVVLEVGKDVQGDTSRRPHCWPRQPRKPRGPDR